MTFTVYKVISYDVTDHKYGCKNIEKWTIQTETFDTLKQAQFRICELTRTHPSTSCNVVSHLLNISNPEKEKEFLYNWCFSDDIKFKEICKHRRFFLYKPNLKELAKMNEIPNIEIK